MSYSHDEGLYLPKVVRPKLSWKFYFHGEVRQPCLYFKVSECVYTEIYDGKLNVLPYVKIMITS